MPDPMAAERAAHMMGERLASAISMRGEAMTTRTMPDEWFRDLDADEEQVFRQWARDNYVVGSDINSMWHPVVADECNKMNEEGK